MKICIVGGGTAGWWCAGYLEKHCPEYEITLIESDTIPKIGVGESTLPVIKSFFDSLEIDESAWMDRCHAIRKYGNIKQGWTDLHDDPFTFSFWFNDNNVFDSWITEYQEGKKSKNQINNDLYHESGWSAYAYHLDAELAGSVVKEQCKKVNHIIRTIDNHSLPDADLYIDCTGFHRALVKDHTLINFNHHLVDSAVVMPYKLNGDIDQYTHSIARPYGWQFIINLQNRTGTGYCYSSKFASDEIALEQFLDFNKHLVPYNNNPPRVIKWTPSVLKNSWCDNVVAIGSSSGFIDPLESNALFMTQFQIKTLVKCLKENKKPEVYNRLVNKVWYGNSTYILHHYMLSNRQDTDFWRYYYKFDVRKSLWENYKAKGNKYTNIYPDAIWASLGLYYDELTFYSSK